MLIPRMGSIWRAIRYYVGRLGSWWYACTALISTVEMDARIFLYCQVRVVLEGEKVTTALLRRAQVAGGEETMSRLARQQCETYIHAELLVLNYFCRRNLAFTQNTPYIGCSKLSCYCCHIYMELQPYTVIPCSCHGNTWT